MLALVNTPNGPAPIELREIPDPVPTRDDALVQVHAFSLNRGELSSFARNKQGWVPGQDIAGTVLQPAASGRGPAAGARVVALVDDFGWAERAAVPSHRMAVLPDGVSFAQASTLPVAGLTALRTLRHGGPLVGRRVLITGAAGGVGTLAVQIAARSGAHVTAVVGRPERGAGLRELGAADVITAIDQAQGRFALILESAGGASLATSLQSGRSQRHDRRLRQLLRRTHHAELCQFPRRAECPHPELQLFHLGSRGTVRPDLALLVSLIADGALKPQIGVERDWRDLLAVGEQLRARQIAGKAVFTTGAR